MDGLRLAAERAPLLARRARAVRERRGRAPGLLLVAFAAGNGPAPHVEGKLRACTDAGIDAVPLIFPAQVTSADALEQMRAAIAERAWDGVFLQFPYPAGIDGDTLADAIPAALDVDVMTNGCTAHYFAHADALPPVTVAAALLLLDRYAIDIAGRHGVVVAEGSPFSLMFSEALARRGAVMQPLLSPDAPDLHARIGGAQLVIVAAARPGLLRADQLPAGIAAIDVGYFNPRGRGDIAFTTDTIQHLAAFAPVPGGIGPMTVSALLERVIHFAERA